jgi:hypothetical protein
VSWRRKEFVEGTIEERVAAWKKVDDAMRDAVDVEWADADFEVRREIANAVTSPLWGELNGHRTHLEPSEEAILYLLAELKARPKLTVTLDSRANACAAPCTSVIIGEFNV